MWGDKDDIDKLKKAEKQGWPDFPPIDPKKAKKEEAERAKADRAAEWLERERRRSCANIMAAWRGLEQATVPPKELQ